MTEKWTEGPWCIEWHDDDTFALMTTQYADDADGRPIDGRYSIIEGCGPVMTGDAENKANAHLIAAAPELYEALDWAMDYCERLDVFKRRDEDMVNAAHAALAKARGEQT